MTRALLATAALVLALAGTASADERLADVLAPTSVSAYGGRVVWSAYEPATLRHRLMTRFHGRTYRVALEGNPGPFDVDLGPGSRGEVVAVYSRCTQGGPSECDVYRYDFSSGQEEKVRAASLPGVIEHDPTVWRDRVAFVRGGGLGPDRSSPEGEVPELRIARLSGTGSRALPAPKVRAEGLRASGLQLQGGRLAFVWGYDLGEGSGAILYSGRLGRGPGRVAALEGLDRYGALVGPAYSGAHLYFGRRRQLFRAPLGGGRIQGARVGERLTGVSVDRNRVYYASLAEGGSGATHVRRATALRLR